MRDIPNGVETVTTSDDAAVTKLLREHVWQMKFRIEDGRPIRQMDPLFREIFANHEHIHMQIEDVRGDAPGDALDAASAGVRAVRGRRRRAHARASLWVLDVVDVNPRPDAQES